MNTTETYPQRLYSLAKQDPAAKGTIILDLSDEKHYSFALDMFGGSESLNERFPLTSMAIENARKESGETQRIEDQAVALDVTFDKKHGKLHTNAYTNLAKQAKVLSQILFIYRNGELIDRNTAYTYGSTQSFVENTTTYLDDIKKGDELAFIMQTNWHPSDTDTFESMITYDIRDTRMSPLDEIVSDIKVIDPRHKYSPDTSEITFAYGRDAKEHEVIDYTYKKVKLAESQKVYLENRGAVTLHDDVEFIEGDPDNTSIVLNHETLGSVHYSTPIPQSAFRKTADNAFEWDFDCDWGTTMAAPSIKSSPVYDYDLHLAFFAREKGKEAKRYSINVSSLEKDEHPHYKKISSLKMLWGCLAQGTRVTMADGELKPIEEIRSGDWVMGIYGFPLKVVNVYRGEEPEMHVVRTETGHEIMATLTHPFLTEKGMAPLESMNLMDRVELGDGWVARITQCFPVPYAENVYNLDIEDGQPFICNGFVVGDFATQNAFGSGDESSVDVPLGLVRETEQLIRMVS